MSSQDSTKASRKRPAESDPEEASSESASTPATSTPEEDVVQTASEPALGDDMRDADGGIRIDDIYIAPPPPPALTFETDGPRLIITHITNENFKSYAGQHVLGPFHKSFTSIVGPNGSGKSNVIDSMLFVFGYRAQKIRSKKISVLIHNSENHPNVQSCKVQVHFQEIVDDDTEPHGFKVVPDSQFVVARSASKDNSSHYEVDGRRCQFKEVAALLRKKGVDLDHNRFLILQGEVEQIALMKPKGQNENDTGMLEFLEDIVGSSRYKEPIEVLHQRVAELDEFRTEKLNRVKLVEKEKDELEKPKNEAMAYLNLANDIVRQQNIGYHHYVQSYGKKLEKTKQKKAEFEENAKEVLSKLNAILEKRNAKEEKFKAVQSEMDKLRRDMEETEEHFKEFELEDTKLKNEMKNLNVKRKKATAQAKQEQENVERLEQVPESNRAKIAECEDVQKKYVVQVDQEQASYDAALETLKVETQEFQDKKETLETELITMQKDENEKESKLNVAQTEVDLLKSNEQKEKCKLEQMQQRLTNATTGFTEASSKVKDHEKALPALKKSLNSMETELSNVNKEYNALQQRVGQTRSQYEETKSAQAATKSRGKVHDALMKQKQTGVIKGIYGRLGDLGAIDKKYDVAVSTAAAGALDTLVVDTVDTASECIMYLKQHDVGRANFMAHEKTVRFESNVRGRFDGPENAPRLVDLIRLENEDMRTVFYHYLRDTLVADNMEQAQRLAFGGRQRFRVVTLGGEVIEISGAMAGGGQKMSGKMGTQIQAKTDDSDLRALEKSLRKDEAQLATVSERKQELDQRLYAAKKEASERERALKKLSLDVKSLSEEKEILESQIVTQKKLVKQAEPDKKKLDDMNAKVEALRGEYEEAMENSREMKESVQKLNKKIKEVAGNKVKAARGKLDAAKDKLDKIRKETTRLNVEIATSERDLKKARDKCEAFEAEVKETEDKMREMKTEREAVEARGKDVIDRQKELMEKEKEGNQCLQHYRDALAKLEKEENKFKSDRIEIEQVNEKFASAIKEQTKTVHHWKREISKLELKDVPGEDTEALRTFESEEDLQELEELNIEAWQAELNVLEENLKAQRPDLNAIDEFKRKESVYLERVAELEEITAKKDAQRRRHDDLRKMRLNEFMAGFGIITSKLKEMYQMITLGGDAELELVDSLDPFTEGIVFSVRPPKKSWKNISNLSGGEKTLSSLALVFALHYYKPTPLYVMDEIDAALDFKNVSIVANYIKERTKNAQFIIISLRANMFELADRLVGIYKTYNCTKSVTFNPGSSVPEQTKVAAKWFPGLFFPSLYIYKYKPISLSLRVANVLFMLFRYQITLPCFVPLRPWLIASRCPHRLSSTLWPLGFTMHLKGCFGTKLPPKL